MLAKLSFRNAKRQAHDYIIYFVTLTAIFSLIHGLNSLLFAEDDIFPLDDSTFILPMILISSLLFSISLWLTSYMTNFILKRRSKEISIYITLGMEPYQISKVFTLENFYISIFALILSFLCGSFVYQVLKAVSFNLLGKPYSLTFHFSLYPFVITFLYFLFTFLFSSFRSIKIIQKSQPQDLLQYDSPHKIPSSVLILRAKLLFPASIICITLSAIFFLLQPLSESANFTFGTLFSILFIYLFFHYFPAWIFDWLEKGSWKYHSVRLLVLRAFTARINDMSNSFAFLTSSFTVSLSLIAVVAISIFTFNYRLSLVPFTFSIITSQNQNHLADYDIYIKEKYPNSHSCTYTIYQSTSSAFTSSIPGFTLYNAVIMPYSEFDLCISHSDYSALRSLLGYAPISLNENEYIVHCLSSFQGTFKTCAEQHSTLDIGDNNLSFAGICTEPLDQYDGYSNGNLFLLVVPDSVVGSLSTYYSKYSTLMDEPFSHAEYCEMQDVFPNLISLRSDSSSSLIKSSPVDYIDISDDIRQTNGFLYITSALPVLYIAIILSVSGFTVIASNVLCENLKASHDFRILKNIGYDIHTLEKITLSIVQRRSLFFFYLFHLLSLLRRALFCAFQKTSFLFLCFYNSIYSFIWYLFCNLFYFIAERNHFYRLRRKTSMSAKKSKTFFKTLTAILVLLLFFGGYYIYSSGIFGASVTENISEHSITDEERLIEYEEYGITYDESSQSYLYQDSLIKNLRDGDFLYTNAAGSIKLIIQRDDNGHIQSIDVE